MDARGLSKAPRVRYPGPVLRLARLAVHERLRGEGIGRRLLRFSIELAERMRDEYGCVGVVVDSKPRAADFYARYGFERIGVMEGEAQQIPSPVPMFLSLGAVPRPAGRR